MKWLAPPSSAMVTLKRTNSLPSGANHCRRSTLSVIIVGNNRLLAHRSHLDRYFHSMKDVKDHLISKGLFAGYVVWNRHGEEHCIIGDCPTKEASGDTTKLKEGEATSEDIRTDDIDGLSRYILCPNDPFQNPAMEQNEFNTNEQNDHSEKFANLMQDVYNQNIRANALSLEKEYVFMFYSGGISLGKVMGDDGPKVTEEIKVNSRLALRTYGQAKEMTGRNTFKQAKKVVSRGGSSRESETPYTLIHPDSTCKQTQEENECSGTQ
ncbi:hypothetical protein KFK09_004033 [Dendrobium nobile]|uniref:Uncharacterized protein n=1 Tax=Dendrobium nobile TaxID=94219 RepID=A0A8T3C490_DENNO|nr:hypothetical protein KFK09_004033 [Dendrobium nobile]